MEFRQGIDEEIYDNFMQSQPKSHFLQSVLWGKFKSLSSWQYELVGVTKDNQLVACAMVLKRVLYLNKTILYMPRGFVMDYNDHELFAFFTQQLKQYAKKQQAIFFRIDPDISNNQMFFDMFIENGYKHNGFNLNFENTQPRFTFRLDLKPIEASDIVNKFDPKRRAAIKVAQKSHIEIMEAKDQGDLFYDLMYKTSQRQGFAIHSKDYFDTLFKTYQDSDKLKIMYAKLDFKKTNEKLAEQLQLLKQEMDVLLTRVQTKKTENKYNELKAQADRMDKLIQENCQQAKTLGESVIVAAAVIIYEGNKAWYVYGASDETFSHLCAVDLMQLKCISDAKARGIEVYDFFGTTADDSKDNPLYGIYQFKKKYGGTMTEFIGEFDYVLKPVSYRLFYSLYPKVLAFLVKRKTKRK